MNTFAGKPEAAAGRFAVIVARFNETITSRLLEGAVQTLTEHGIDGDQIDVYWVPGAFEIPTVAGRLADDDEHVAVICLGAVIRGETSHDEHINRSISLAIAELGMDFSLPIIFGVLTCNTVEQAVARSGGDVGSRGKDQPGSRLGNKGCEAALAALEMVNLMKQL